MVAAALVGLALSACAVGPARSELVVGAASSLTNAFGEIEDAFEATHPEVDVVISFSGSSTLREQILEGSPVEVFASADEANMATVAGAGLISGEPLVFATNRLEIAVPPSNPAAVEGLADFTREELLLGLCAEGVPCGDLARASLAQAGVVPIVDSNEPDVRSLLAKIEAGELDAGITYATDVMGASGRVEGIEIPEEHNVVATYSIAVLSTGAAPTLGAELVAFVVSERGRAIMAGHGFGRP